MATDMQAFRESVLGIFPPDYILDDDEEFEVNEMKKFSNYESAEVIIPDDCELSDDGDEKITSEKIPPVEITFVDENRIGVVQEYGETSKGDSSETAKKKKKAVSYICSNCNKPYVRESSYKKHIQICGSKQKNSEPAIQQKTGQK